jgi:peptidoglycan/xylan/chitin deacetylase (PgdA/CDA1 family)
MRFIGVPKIVKGLLPSAIWRIPTQEKTIYLTFDDGPTERTHEILHLLKRYQAKATFFCVGANAKKHPDLITEILDAGHTIGNHSWSHLKGWRTKTDAYLADIERANGVLQSELFRPPYGKMTWKQYRLIKAQYKIIMWSHLSYDFDISMPEEVFYDRLFTKYQAGDIVVLHDNLKYFDRSINMLKSILEWTEKEGICCLAI